MKHTDETILCERDLDIPLALVWWVAMFANYLLCLVV